MHRTLVAPRLGVIPSPVGQPKEAAGWIPSDLDALRQMRAAA
jgi:hypothetical protein